MFRAEARAGPAEERMAGRSETAAVGAMEARASPIEERSGPALVGMAESTGPNEASATREEMTAGSVGMPAGLGDAVSRAAGRMVRGGAPADLQRDTVGAEGGDDRGVAGWLSSEKGLVFAWDGGQQAVLALGGGKSHKGSDGDLGVHGWYYTELD
jgi:hypothetical protein